MRTRNNTIIIDTETVGTFGAPLIHDFGYVIVDKDFNVLQKDRFLVAELHKDGHWILKTSDFYNDYAETYKRARKAEKILPWAEIAGIVEKAIRQWKVTTISAYNLAFDYKAIKYTEMLFNRKKQNLAKVLDHKTKNLLCIYNLACETILQTEEYHKFARENGLISESGNYRTNAEACYRFITGKTEYVEEHTALSDAEDEAIILQTISKQVKGTPNYGLFYNCWQKAQK